MHKRNLDVGLQVFFYREGTWYRGTIIDLGHGSTWKVRADEDILYSDGSGWPSGGELICLEGDIITWMDLSVGDTILSKHPEMGAENPLTVTDQVRQEPRTSSHGGYAVNVKNRRGIHWALYIDSPQSWNIELCRPHTVKGWPKRTTEKAVCTAKWDPKQGDVVTYKYNGEDRRAVILRIDPSTRLKYLLVVERYHQKVVCATKATAVKELPNTAQIWATADDINPYLGSYTKHYSQVQDIIPDFPIWWGREVCPVGTSVKLNSGMYQGQTGFITEWYADEGICRVRLSSTQSYTAYPYQYYPIAIPASESREVFDRHRIEQQKAQLQAQYPVRPEEAFAIPPPPSYAEVFGAPKAGKTMSAHHAFVDLGEKTLANGAAAIDPLPVPKLVSLDDDITILKPL